MLININDRLQVTDFYYPHVGQENHLAQFSNKLFFRINGKIVELNHDAFSISTKYIIDSLVGYSILTHLETGIEIIFEDFVVPNNNAFVRKFEIINKSKDHAEIYIYFQNNFSIYENDIGDTAIWYQPAGCLVHYKKNRYIGVASTDRIHQFTCAARTDNDNLGAHPNLETGELYLNPISNGSVNSCVSYKFNIKPGENKSSNYINIAGYNFDDVDKNLKKLKGNGVENILETTTTYWQNWVRSKTNTKFPQKTCPKFFGEDDLDCQIYDLYKRSLLTIRTQVDNGGAIIAANDGRYLKQGGKDTYSYFWPRDGAYIILALIECGFKELSDNYFKYINNLLTPGGYFLHKYFAHGSHDANALGSSWHPWIDNFGTEQLPIQEDETALNIFAIWKHYEKFADQEFLKKYWDTLIFPMLNFIGNYRYTIEYETTSITDHVKGYPDIKKASKFDETFAGSKLPRPSYDLWEERRGVTTFTCVSVYAGLKAGAKLSEAFGRSDYAQTFNQYADEVKTATEKHLYDSDKEVFRSRINCDPFTNSYDIDNDVDSSLYSVWHFDMFDISDPKVKSTMKELEKRLTVDSEIGGIARRENDFYHRIDHNLVGNPWFICTLWMAQYYIKKGDKNSAKKYIQWAIDHSDASGLMAEQAHPYTGHGESVKPLTWSHAEFVRTVNMMVA